MCKPVLKYISALIYRSTINRRYNEKILPINCNTISFILPEGKNGTLTHA